MKKIFLFILLSLSLLANYQGSYFTPESLNYRINLLKENNYSIEKKVINIDVFYIESYSNLDFALLEAKKRSNKYKELLLLKEEDRYVLYYLGKLENNFKKVELTLTSVYSNQEVEVEETSSKNLFFYENKHSYIRTNDKLYRIEDNFYYPSDKGYPYTIQNIPIGDTIVLNSKNKVHVTSFYNNYYFDMKEVYFYLNYTHSPLLDTNNSTLTLFINDIPVHSEPINNEKRNVKISIPLEYLIKGFNEISIRTNNYLINEKNKDEANWFRIEKDSYTHMYYLLEKDLLKLYNFPYPYFVYGHNNFVNTYIVSHDNISSNKALLNLTSSLSRLNKTTNIKYEIKSIYEKVDYSKNYIYVGSLSDTPEWIKKHLNKDMLERSKKEAIALEVPLGRNNNLLILGSDNQKALEKMAEIFPYKVHEFLDNPTYINEDFYLSYKKFDNIRTIESFGYKDTSIKGKEEVEVNYTLKLPLNKSLKDDPEFLLDFAYSSLIDSQKSYVDLYVNDIIVASKRLDATNGSNDTLLFRIPKEVEVNNVLNLRFAFKLVSDNPSKIWLNVKRSSSLKNEFRDKKFYYLSDLFGPYFSDEGIMSIDLLLDKDFSMITIEKLVNFLSAMSSKSFVPLDFNIVYDEKDIKNDSNVIILTKSPQNFGRFNNDLIIKYDYGKNTFVSEELKFEGNYGKRIGVGQVVKSDNRFVVVLSGHRNEQINWILDTLINQNNMLNSSAFTIDENNIITLANERITKIDKDAFERDYRKRATDSYTLDESKVFIGIIALILFFFISFILYYKKIKGSD